MKKLIWLSLILTTLGCVEGNTELGDPVDDCFLCDGKADRLSFTEAEADGVLALVNSLSRRALDDEVALDRRAANNIVDSRSENGGFIDLDEVVAVPYVGKTAFSKMLVYAKANGFVARGVTGTVHGIDEQSEDAERILTVVNNATSEILDDDVALDRRAANNIVDARPIGSLKELDSVGYVGKRAFERLLAYVGSSCDTAAPERVIRAVNDGDYRDYAREIRTDVSVSYATTSRAWPAEMTHAGCFGIRPSEVPSWIPVVPAEDNTRLLSLFRSYGNAVNRDGADIDISAALDSLRCQTDEKQFIGCRFEFQPDPWSGITWTVLEAEDGTSRYLFESRWSE